MIIQVIHINIKNLERKSQINYFGIWTKYNLFHSAAHNISFNFLFRNTDFFFLSFATCILYYYEYCVRKN